MDGEIDAVIEVLALGAEPLLKTVVEDGVEHPRGSEMKFDLCILVEVGVGMMIDHLIVLNACFSQIVEHLFAMLV